jgi:hypothetical protein
MPHWEPESLYNLFAQRWLLTIAEDFQQAQSPKLRGDVFPDKIAGRVKGTVVKALKAAGCSVALFLAVDIVVNKKSRRFGLVLTREGELPSPVVADIHQRVKKDFEVTLHFEKLAAMRRVRHSVAALRKADLVIPLSPNSKDLLRGHGRVMSAGLPVLGLEHLPTVCIDAVGTKCHEDAITGWRHADRTTERWVFFPDRAFVDRYYAKTATPSFGVGWIEHEGRVKEMKPLVAALVKAHRIIDEVDVAKSIEVGSDLPKRVLQMIGVLKDSVAGNLGRALSNSELGSAIVMNTILTAGHLLAEDMVQSGMPVIVRPHYSRAPVVQLLSELGVAIHPWEMKHDGILGFKLMLAAAQRAIEFEAIIVNLTGGVFRVATDVIASNEIAKLKGDRIDGRLNQSIVRSQIYGVEGESVEVMRQACEFLNKGLAKRSSLVKGVMRSEDAARLVRLYQSGRVFSGTVESVDLGNEEILVNVDLIGRAILPAFYLPTAVISDTKELRFIPAGWDVDRRLPFVAAVT